MFERYTDKARRVVFFARFEASTFGSPTIETEHLLLALLREDKPLLDRIVRSQSSGESMRERIERQIPKGEKVSTSTDLPLAEATKRVLRFAEQEAQNLSHVQIGPGHLLLGLLHEHGSVATEVLHEWGARLETAREEVSRTEAERSQGAALSMPEKESLVPEFSRDLTQAARRGELDPLVGREQELERVVQVLCRRSRNNPVLVGDSGVGKAALVKGLAIRIAEGNVSLPLANKRILNLYVSSLAAGSKGHEVFERRLKTTAAELMGFGNVIIFVEELFTSTSVGGSLDTVNILRPAFLRGDFQCIASSTPEDYQRSVEREPWLERCFFAVRVNPPGAADTLKILLGIKERYEQFHGVTYTDQALEDAVRYSERFIASRCLPDKAIDLMDEAGACVKLRRHSQPQELIEMRKHVTSCVQGVEAAVADHDFEKARFYSEEERKAREDLRQLEAKLNVDNAPKVTREDIQDAVARWTGLPVVSIRPEAADSGEQ